MRVATYKITVRCNDDTYTLGEHFDGTNDAAYARTKVLVEGAKAAGHRVEEVSYERVSDWREVEDNQALPAGYSITIAEGSACLYRGVTLIDHYADEELAAEHAWELFDAEQEQVERDAAAHGPWGAPYPPTAS